MLLWGDNHIYRSQLDGDTRGDFESHNKELFVNAGMEDFHRCLVAGIAITATNVSAILTVNRYKKREILLAVISKDKKRKILKSVRSKDKKREILLAVNSKDRKTEVTEWQHK